MGWKDKVKKEAKKLESKLQEEAKRLEGKLQEVIDNPALIEDGARKLGHHIQDGAEQLVGHLENAAEQIAEHAKCVGDCVNHEL